MCKSVDPLELELETGLWVLGIELRFFGRVASALNGAIFSAPQHPPGLLKKVAFAFYVGLLPFFLFVSLDS